MSERFYSHELIRSAIATLDGDEAHHVIRVMRRNVGDEVTLFDGSGDEFRARLTGHDRRQASFEILERTRPAVELPGRLAIATALPKGDRQRIAIEKCVELGVHELIPLETARGVAECTPAAIQRLRRAVVESTKQSGRTRLMEVCAPRRAEDLFRRADAFGGSRWIADPSGEAFRATLLGLEVLLAIGPEGGWTPDELRMARESGWRVISLGPRILRIETAVIALAATAAQRIQELQTIR